jgi:hypothetical protein
MQSHWEGPATGPPCPHSCVTPGCILHQGHQHRPAGDAPPTHFTGTVCQHARTMSVIRVRELEPEPTEERAQRSHDEARPRNRYQSEPIHEATFRCMMTEYVAVKLVNMARRRTDSPRPRRRTTADWFQEYITCPPSEFPSHADVLLAVRAMQEARYVDAGLGRPPSQVSDLVEPMVREECESDTDEIEVEVEE